MEFEQFYLGCLAQASYLVGDAGECAIVDPRRDVDLYVEEAERRGLTIRWIIETHLHADFVSGHLELARRTGARILIGHRAEALFDHEPVHDGHEVVMGRITLRFLETPGHTPESLCVLVLEDGVPRRLLTGDTLFIGDVGRPDLVGSKGHSAEEMARMMYASLRDKVLSLPDEVEVYPAHGAGSACGRNISSALSSTLGEQRATNAALQPMDEDAFVASVTAGLGAPPRYFPRSAELNRQGAAALDELSGGQPLGVQDFADLVERDAVVLDVRSAEDFAAGHVPGALRIGLDGNFASWAGVLLPLEATLVLLVDDAAAAAEAVLRLARVGAHGVAGYLEGGMQAWVAADRTVATLERIDVADLAAAREQGAAPAVLDVRQPGEYAAGHVPGARNVPVAELEARLDELDRAAPLAVVCATGYRSLAAASLLHRHGFPHVIDVIGGTVAWEQSGLPLERPAATGASPTCAP